jgi:hypothetical protein
MLNVRPVAALLALCLPITASHLLAADNDATFPFAVAWDDASPSVIDSSHLIPAPLTGGPLRAVGGHLVDSDGKRVRLLGVNIVAGGCFPAAADAPIIARRLRRLGVSCVRLHHMDSAWAKPNLFSATGGVAERPSPESLAKLDGLIAALAEQGIRVDLNLHVGRVYGPELGYPKLPAGSGAATHGKAVGFFESRAAELQRQFARDLLDHVNPQRGMRLADDPVLAMVELVNEDTLVGANHLIDDLPEPWLGQLTARWNAFLATRYRTTEAALAAWNNGVKPNGPDLVGDGTFATGIGAWSVEQHQGATIDYGVEDPAGATDRPAGRMLRLSPTKLDGTNWHLQAHRPGLTLVPGETYTLAFAARSAAPRKLSVSTKLDHAPWTDLGLNTNVKLDSAWRRFALSFVASATAGAGSRISFILGDSSTEVCLADLTLKSGGGGVALTPEQRIESATVPLLEVDATPAGRDFAGFLIATEDEFCQSLRRFVHEDLKCQAPVLASQASYGGIAGLRRETRLDMVDMHAYWQHPSFPRHGWDPNDFRIENTPMALAADGGALMRVGQYRAAGMPFTVTEYDHPAPSEYAAETVPLAYAVAARQDWDGVFLFDYLATSEPAMRESRLASFFSCSQHPAKLAFLPLAAEMFLAGGMPAATGKASLTIPAAQVEALTGQRVGNGFWRLGGAGAEQINLLTQRMEVSFGDVATPQLALQPATDAPAMTWSDGAQARVLLHAPRIAGAIGLIRGQTIDAGALRITAEANPRNFAAVAIASRDGQPLTSSTRMLLAAVDKAENSDLQWAADRHSAKKAWSGTVQVTGVSAALELQTTLPAATVWALDGRGVRTTQVASTISDGKLRFRISPDYKTVWYEVSAAP